MRIWSSPNITFFQELHRAHFFYGHGVLHEARFIKAYGVLKIINSVKHSIMQISFFYDGVLHKATFINEYGVLKLSIIQKLHVVPFFFCKCMEYSMAQYLQKSSNYILSLENNYFVPKIIIFVPIKICPSSNHNRPTFNYLCLFKNDCTNKDSCPPNIILTQSFFISIFETTLQL